MISQEDENIFHKDFGFKLHHKTEKTRGFCVSLQGNETRQNSTQHRASQHLEKSYGRTHTMGFILLSTKNAHLKAVV